MSTMTIKADGIFTDLITEAEQSDGYGSTFLHEDGSVTVISQDYMGWSDCNPRDDDMNIATLVSDSRDYNPLDDGDSEIEEMRDYYSNLFHLTDHWVFEVDEWDGEPCFSVSIKADNGYSCDYDLDNPVEARVVAAYFLGLNAEQAMDHYVATERPDILWYKHEWSVSGSSQSDWRDGYAFIYRADMVCFGFDEPTAEQAKAVGESELHVYGLWFAGEVFYSTTIHPCGEDYAIGAAGGYFTGQRLGWTESYYGHLGYPSIRAIAEGNSTSPVVEQVR